MRSGSMKSSMALPSRRNSGLEATAKRSAGRCLADDGGELAAGADRNRGLRHDDRELVRRTRMGGDRARRLLDRRIDKAESAPPPFPSVGVPTAMKSTSTPPHDRLVDVGRETQQAAARIGGDELLETRLVDRDLAGLQPGDLRRVLVDADDVVAKFRQAGAGHQADIAGPDHADIQHCEFPLSIVISSSARGTARCQLWVGVTSDNFGVRGGGRCYFRRSDGRVLSPDRGVEKSI